MYHKVADFARDRPLFVTFAVSRFNTLDRTAAEDEIAVVEDEGLAGRDRPLRPIENEPHARAFKRPDGGGVFFLAIPCPGRCAQRTIRFRDRKPVEIRRGQLPAVQRALRTHGHGVLLHILSHDVKRLFRRDAEPPALTDRIADRAVMTPDHAPVRIEDLALRIAAAGPALEKRAVISVGDEADVLALVLGRGDQPAIMELVALGYGVSFIHESHLRHRSGSLSIDCFSFGEPRTVSDFVAATRKGSYISRYAQDYIEIVKQQVKPSQSGTD